MKLDDETRNFLDSNLAKAVKAVEQLRANDPPLEDGVISELCSVLACDLRREKGFQPQVAQDLVGEYFFELAEGRVAKLYVNSIP